MYHKSSLAKAAEINWTYSQKQQLTKISYGWATAGRTQEGRLRQKILDNMLNGATYDAPKRREKTMENRSEETNEIE